MAKMKTMKTYFIAGSDEQSYYVEADYFRVYHDNKLGVYRRGKSDPGSTSFTEDEQVFFANSDGWLYIRLVEDDDPPSPNSS